MSKTSEARINVFINAEISKRELDKLQTAAKATADKISKIGEGHKDFEKLNTQLQRQTAAANNFAKVLSGEVQPSMAMMRDGVRRLRAELDKLPVSTAAYNAKLKELKGAEGVMAKHQAQINGTAGVWAKSKTLVQGYGVAALAALGGGAIITAVGSMITKNAELSDSLAAVQKTTGMSKAEVEELNKSFGTFNTRTARAELIKIAQVAGQFGIAKDQIQDFTKQVDMAVVALGDEFTGGAEEVAKQLGGLQNLFKDTSALTAGEAISRIGSAINELGAAGSATGPEVAEFARRIGALGGLAPTITQTMGLGAAMQELGLTAEIAASGLTKILTETATRGSMFSAEMQALQNSNPNEFLLRLAESFKGLSNTQLATRMGELGLASQEATKVMSLLAGKTDMVREKQDLANKSFGEATSLQKEFNTMNSTFAANLEKIGKKISSWFTSSDLVNFFDAIASSIAKSIEPMKDYSNGLNAQHVAMEQQRVTFNALMEVLQDTTTTEKERATIMKRINTEYSALLPNTLKETMGLTELRDIQNEVNEGLERRIRAKSAEARLQEITNQQLERSIAIQKTEEEIINLKTELKKPKATIYERQIGASEKGSTTVAIDANQQNAAIKTSIAARYKQIAELEGLNAELQKQFEQIYHLTGGDAVNPKASGTGQTSNMAEVVTGSVNAQDKAYQEAMQKLQHYTDDVARLRAEVTAEQISEDAKARATLNAKYDEMVRKAKEAAADELRNDKLSRGQRLEIEAGYNRQIYQVNLVRASDMAALEQSISERHSEARKEGLKQEQTYLDELTKLARTFGQTQAQIDAQELIDLKAKHAKELEEAVRHQAEMLANMELSEAERVAIYARYEESIAALRASQLEGEKAREQELQTKREGDQAEGAAKIAVAINPDSLELERLAVEKHYAELLALAQKHNLDTKGLSEAKERDLQKLLEQGAQKAIEKDQTVLKARMDMYSTFGNAIADVANLASQAGEEGSEFQRATAVAQILINTAMSVSNAIAGATAAAASNGPAAPFVIGAYIATMVASVITGMAQASQTLAKASVPAGPRFSGPGFYQGGYTGNGTGQLDSDGRQIAGVVHAGEYVIPKRLLENPVIFNMTRKIEEVRTGSTSSTVSANGIDPAIAAKLDMLIAAQIQTNELLANYPTHIRAVVSSREVATAIDDDNRAFNNSASNTAKRPLISGKYGV